jgi:hypothetical protein
VLIGGSDRIMSTLKSDEKRIERNKKRREAYRMKKDESQSKAVPAGQCLNGTIISTIILKTTLYSVVAVDEHHDVGTPTITERTLSMCSYRGSKHVRLLIKLIFILFNLYVCPEVEHHDAPSTCTPIVEGAPITITCTLTSIEHPTGVSCPTQIIIFITVSKLMYAMDPDITMHPPSSL